MQQVINSLAPGRYGSKFKSIISTNISCIQFMTSSNEFSLRRMPQNTCEDKLTLVQILAWCHWATSHYLNQCWLRSVSPYCIISSQWVNQSLTLKALGANTLQRVTWRVFPWMKTHVLWNLFFSFLMINHWFSTYPVIRYQSIRPVRTSFHDIWLRFFSKLQSDMQYDLNSPGVSCVLGETDVLW